jgi:hypothetical protein
MAGWVIYGGMPIGAAIPKAAETSLRSRTKLEWHKLIEWRGCRRGNIGVYRLSVPYGALCSATGLKRSRSSLGRGDPVYERQSGTSLDIAEAGGA